MNVFRPVGRALDRNNCVRGEETNLVGANHFHGVKGQGIDTPEDRRLRLEWALAAHGTYDFGEDVAAL